MTAPKALIQLVVCFLVIPVIVLVAAVGLIGSIVGSDTAAGCVQTTAPSPASTMGGGGWIATAYGPPWDAMNGSGVTATGINLTAGQPALVIAVDPTQIPLRTFVHVQPNPFGTSRAFYAGDTGGAIIGRHVDIYDWQGRQSQLAWGVRLVTVTPAPDPGTGPLLGEITPTTPAGAPALPASCPVAIAGPLPLTPGSRAVILPSGLAAAPRDAPAAVKLAIAAGNELISKPYVYGGGHGIPLPQLASGYDCSGSTSFVLYAAGVLHADYAPDSTGLETWGQPGPGRWITVYTNSAHVFVDVDGVVMDTAWYAPVQPTVPGSGPRWQPEQIIGPQYQGDQAAGNGGFIQRHPPGL
ncbi:MAG: 3D domain-containing protein [Solirubrobacteraceae bacterium]